MDDAHALRPNDSPHTTVYSSRELQTLCSSSCHACCRIVASSPANAVSGIVRPSLRPFLRWVLINEALMTTRRALTRTAATVLLAVRHCRRAGCPTRLPLSSPIPLRWTSAFPYCVSSPSRSLSTSARTREYARLVIDPRLQCRTQLGTVYPDNGRLQRAVWKSAWSVPRRRPRSAARAVVHH